MHNRKIALKIRKSDINRFESVFVGLPFLFNIYLKPRLNPLKSWLKSIVYSSFKGTAK